MDRIWLEAPLPALRVFQTGDGVTARCNAAARQWAWTAGVAEAELEALAVRARDAAASSGALLLGGAALPYVRVPLDGTAAGDVLVWLWPPGLPDPTRRGPGPQAADSGPKGRAPTPLADPERAGFAARMNHELSASLSALLAATRQLLADAGEPPSPRQRERLGQIAAAAQQLVELVEDPRRPAHGRPEPAAGGLHVLCVEDNPVNLQLVRELMALRPRVRLRTAEDGLSGVAAALAERPDLLLLDLQLPDIDGMEVMRRVRGEPALAGCRIVALSADAMPDRIEAALAAGFDDYWTKPIQFDAFLGQIDRLAAELS